MTDDVPTTAEVRERFVDGFPMDTWVASRDECGADFDRWLAEHDRVVAERAWDEGARWALTSYVRRSVRRSARRPQIALEFGRSLDKSRVGLVPSDNPYRKEQENNNA